MTKMPSMERAAQILAALEAAESAGHTPLTKPSVYEVAAQSLGVGRETLRRSWRKIRSSLGTEKLQALRGELGTQPVLPGFEIKQTSTQLNAYGELEREWIRQRPERGDEFEVPEGHIVKGVSALVDADGRTIQQWVKTKEGRDPLDVVEIIKAAMADLPFRAEPTVRPIPTIEPLLTLYPANDWHIGMYSWGRETGTNWDLKLAVATIADAMSALVARSPASKQAIVLGGGDLLHSDNGENRTAKSGHALDVDGRYAKVLAAANGLMVHTIDRTLSKHDEVLVRILPGNHDEHAAVAVSYFLQGYYRDEPRVTVDVDPGLFWWHRFGKVMLGSTHGHTVKPDQMAHIMAARRPKDWGETLHRYAHTFHLHHKRVLTVEGGGVTTEVHQAPIPADAWHWGAGYLSGRSIQSITYHAEHGEISRTRIALLDA